MCDVIDMKTRQRIYADPTHSRPGVIDVFKAKGGKLGLDACVPVSVASAMGITNNHPSVVCLSSGSGNTAFEAHVLPVVAKRLLERAKAAGVKIRYEREKAA